MSLKYVLLGLLSQQPRYGYQLKPEAERLLGGGAELNPGQLYPLLRKLAEQHLIHGERVEQEDRPDKRVFTLTPAGHDDLMAWLDSPVDMQAARSGLYLRYVVIATVRPARLGDFLREHRHRLFEHIGQLVADRERLVDTDSLPTRILSEASIMHAEADLRWIEWLESLRVEEGAESVESVQGEREERIDAGTAAE